MPPGDDLRHDQWRRGELCRRFMKRFDHARVWSAGHWEPRLCRVDFRAFRMELRQLGELKVVFVIL